MSWAFSLSLVPLNTSSLGQCSGHADLTRPKTKKRTTLTLLIQNILVLVDYIFISCFNEWFLWNWLLFNFFVATRTYAWLRGNEGCITGWVIGCFFFLFSQGRTAHNFLSCVFFSFFSRLLLFQVLLSHLSAPSPFFFCFYCLFYFGLRAAVLGIAFIGPAFYRW